MARELKEFVFARPGAAEKYPWHDWLNGAIWELTQGQDFTSTVHSFRASAGEKARKRGLKLESRILDDGKKIVMRAYKVREGDSEESEQEPDRALQPA